MVRLPRDWDLPSRLILYEDSSTPVLELDEIKGYLERILGVRVETRGDFLRKHHRGNKEDLALKLAGIKVRDVDKPFKEAEPVYGEVMFELRLLDDSTRKVPGVLYDGIRMQTLMREMLPAKERNMRTQHIVFTSRLVGTFEQDGRYHAHVNICGYPALVSTSGIVEAPAKPRDYYLLKQQFITAGGAVPFDLLKERFAGQFIDYDDPRLTEVLKGYVLQCVLYAITKEPFCTRRDCRLFNAHWQSEVLRAQLGKTQFCSWHEEVLERIRAASKPERVKKARS